ncbi:hypothetical protein G4D82_10330 [Flavobacterium sp. CYK-4]|uniref:hypothetical protein n=1 Tax=Flavobacterium lotistagni TaxID=2709660 RepID=UPI00140CBFF9|nr:hypothetical protein [Flavobacterium lotistagni]NHM07619.1 hypothetical protein [Flavobacterium lotistagni]
MKKLMYITVLLFSCILITGCSSAKKMKQETTLIKSDIQKKDSIKNTVVNQEIEDRLITPIIQSNTGNASLDNLVNAKVDEILSKLNTSKNSGDNGYKLIYDKLKKQLEFYARIAQTQSENTVVNNQNDKIIIQEKKIPVEVIKPLSKLEKSLMGLGLLALLYIGMRIVFFIRKKTSVWA